MDEVKDLIEDKLGLPRMKDVEKTLRKVRERQRNLNCRELNEIKMLVAPINNILDYPSSKGCNLFLKTDNIIDWEKKTNFYFKITNH